MKKITDRQGIEFCAKSISNSVDNERRYACSSEASWTCNAGYPRELFVGDIILFEECIYRLYECIKFFSLARPIETINDSPLFVKQREVAGIGDGIDKEVHIIFFL